jgi:hypothetical protein
MKLASALLLAALTSACASSAAQVERPAVIVNPTAQSRAELLSAVRKALNGAPLTLADDALTKESLLIIEPARPRDGNGHLLNGREVRMPERFELRTRNSQCVLVRERTQQRWILRKTRCVAP